MPQNLNIATNLYIHPFSDMASVNSFPPPGKITTSSQTIFQTQFHEWKVLYFDPNFTEICSKGFNWREVIFGSGNCLAPNRQQAITWTICEPVHWHIYEALWGDEVINSLRLSNTYVLQYTGSSFICVIALPPVWC